MAPSDYEKLKERGLQYSNHMDGSQQVAVDQAFLIQNIGALRTTLGTRNYENLSPPFRKTYYMHSNHNCATINKLTWVPKSYDFMNLTPAQISALQPMIRLYKVRYDDTGEPKDEVEMVFPSKTGGTYRVDNEVKNILDDSTDTGIGIKSFEYKFIGSNPATVRNDVEAKLVLYFQNFSELLRTRYGKAFNAAGEAEDVSYRFVDFFDRAGRQKNPSEGTVSSSSRPPATPRAYKAKEAATEYDKNVEKCAAEQPPNRRLYKGPAEFEIKALVGWASQDGTSSVLPASIISALDQTQMALFLTLVDHDFQFEDDGTFTLELNYRARLGGILGDPQIDILNLIEGDTSPRVAGTWLTAAGVDEIFDGTPYQILQHLEEDLKTAESCCNTEFKKTVQQYYNRLIDEIRTYKFRAFGEHLASQGFMYNIVVNATTMNGYAMGKEYGKDKESGGQWRWGSEGVSASSWSRQSGRTTTAKQAETDVFDDNIGETSHTKAEIGDRGPEDRSAQWDIFVEEQRPTLDSTTTQGVNPVLIPYFRLGDMIEYFAKAAMPETGTTYLDDKMLERIQILLGSIRLPRWEANEYGYGKNAVNPLGNTTGESTTHNFNLSDIPISWFRFRDFWRKRVIQPRRKHYPLIQFIRDVISDLVLGAINSEYYYFGGSQAESRAQIRTAYVTLPPTSDGENPVEARANPRSRELNLDDLVGTYSDTDTNTELDVSPLSFMEPTTPAYEQFNYLVVTVEDGTMGDFKKSAIPSGMTRRQHNRTMNIHHFGFGEDRGLLKTANFSKTTQPFLREARYLEDGYNPFQQLSNVYDVKLSLVAAPFFYPGQYVWINPYGLSKSGDYPIGSPDEHPPVDNLRGGSYANLMGLGGYHIIIDVGAYLEGGKFEMTINARYDNSGADSGEREGMGSQDTNRCEDEED